MACGKSCLIVSASFSRSSCSNLVICWASNCISSLRLVVSDLFRSSYSFVDYEFFAVLITPLIYLFKLIAYYNHHFVKAFWFLARSRRNIGYICLCSRAASACKSCDGSGHFQDYNFRPVFNRIPPLSPKYYVPVDKVHAKMIMWLLFRFISPIDKRLLGPVAMDRVGNASASQKERSQGRIYIYMLYSHRRWIRRQNCGRKKKRREKVSLGYKTKWNILNEWYLHWNLEYAIQFVQKEQVENGKKTFDLSQRALFLSPEEASLVGIRFWNWTYPRIRLWSRSGGNIVIS